jgi:hypothetical protein
LAFIVPIFTTIFSALVQSNSRPTRSSSAVFLMWCAPFSCLIRPYSIMPSQPPEAYFTLYPRQSGADVVPRPAGAPITARTTMAATQARPKETLISRYGLESRLPNADVVPSLQQGGGAVWEDTAEKREASLRERKAQMVLAARQYVQLSCTSLRADNLSCYKANVGRTTDTSKLTYFITSCHFLGYPLIHTLRP